GHYDELTIAQALFKKAAVFRSHSFHWQTRSLANAVLNRRDAFLATSTLPHGMRDILRADPIFGSKYIFHEPLKTRFPLLFKERRLSPYKPTRQSRPFRGRGRGRRPWWKTGPQRGGFQAGRQSRGRRGG